MKTVSILALLLLVSTSAFAEYISDGEFRKRVNGTNHTSDREGYLSAYMSQHGGVWSASIGKKIRTQILWLAQKDFYAAAQGARRSRLKTEQLMEVANGLPPDLKSALHLWWDWYVRDIRAQSAANQSRVPYPESLPAPGYPLGQGPRHVLAAPTPRLNTSERYVNPNDILKTDDCETILRKVALRGDPGPGSLVIPKGSDKNCRDHKMLMEFDCSTKSFTVYDPEGARLNQNPSNYQLCQKASFKVCPTCKGRASRKGSAWVQDSAFHQTNFNVYTSDPNARKKIDTYDVCGSCNGVGYLSQ